MPLLLTIISLITYGARQIMTDTICSEARLPYTLFHMRPYVILYSPYTFYGLPCAVNDQTIENTNVYFTIPFQITYLSEGLSNATLAYFSLTSGPDGIRTHVQNESIKFSTCLACFTISECFHIQRSCLVVQLLHTSHVAALLIPEYAFTTAHR